MKEKIKLKPCPFCGGEARCIEFYGLFHVICCDCYISGKDRPSIDGAIEAWNARTIEEAQTVEIKRLREALKFYAELDGNGIQLYGEMDSKALEFIDGASFPFGQTARDALKGGEK